MKLELKVGLMVKELFPFVMFVKQVRWHI